MQPYIFYGMLILHDYGVIIKWFHATLVAGSIQTTEHLLWISY